MRVEEFFATMPPGSICAVIGTMGSGKTRAVQLGFTFLGLTHKACHWLWRQRRTTSFPELFGPLALGLLLVSGIAATDAAFRTQAANACNGYDLLPKTTLWGHSFDAYFLGVAALLALVAWREVGPLETRNA